MRKLRLLLPVAFAVAAFSTSAATAAPSPISFSISSNAQYVAPTTILVPVTYNCLPSAVTAFIFVDVFEGSTGGTGLSFGNPAPCTGSAETIVIQINGGPFAPGKAYARGSASAGGFFDTDQRQIQITV